RVAAVTMRWSLYSGSGLRAVMPIYVGLFIYLAGVPILHWWLSTIWNANGIYKLFFLPALDFIDGGNPFWRFEGIIQGVGQRPIMDEMIAALIPFSLVHLSFTLVCLLWSTF